MYYVDLKHNEINKYPFLGDMCVRLNHLRNHPPARLFKLLFFWQLSKRKELDKKYVTGPTKSKACRFFLRTDGRKDDIHEKVFSFLKIIECLFVYF